MPTYEYACQACENTWEAEQRITEPALTECPKCGAPKAQRLISGSRFVLKGSGWYADGYGSSKPAAKPSGDAKPTEAKGESKAADSKGESKGSVATAADAKSSPSSETKSGSTSSSSSS